MQRAFLALNVVLTILLSVLIWQMSPTDTIVHTVTERSDPTLLPKKSISLITDLRHEKFTVYFDRPMVGEDKVGRMTDENPISLHPFVPIDSIWRTERALECRLPSDMPRSGAYNIYILPGLKSLDGLRVGVVQNLSFVMPGVKVFGITAVIAEKDRRVVHLNTSHEVIIDSLKAHLSIKDEEGNYCSYVIEKDKDRNLYKAILSEDSKPLTVDVRIDKGLKPLDGYPTAEIFARRLRFFEELHIESAYTRNEKVIVSLSRYLGDEFDKNLISLNPPLPFTARLSSYRLKIKAKFIPGSPLTVTLKKGFPGFGDRRLDADETRDLSIGDLDSDLSFVQSGTVLSALATPQFKLEGVNVNDIEVSIRSVYPNNFVEFAKSSDYSRVGQAVYGKWQERRLQSGAAHNQKFTKTINIEQLIEGSASGLYEILLRDPIENDIYTRKIVQITDIGVSVRATNNSMAVAVSSLAFANAIHAAQVTILSRTNQVLAFGQTDEQGLILLNYEKLKGDHAAFLIQVSTKNDLAYVDLEGYAVELNRRGLGGSRFFNKGYEAYVWVDQGVVRPGETIHMTGLVRDKFGKAPSNHKVIINWISPNGKSSQKVSAKTTGSGFVHLEKTFSSESRTGAWRVELLDSDTKTKIGSTSFKIEAFVPQRIEASIQITEILVHGRDAKVKIKANWLEGAPAAGLTVNLFPRFDNTRLKFKNWSNYVFGKPASKSSLGAGPSVRTAFGDDGTVEISVPMPESEHHESAQRARFYAEVLDPSGRIIAVEISEPIYDDKGHLGVLIDGNNAFAIIVDAEGKLMNRNEDITFSIEERQWRWKWREDGDRYRWHHYVNSHEIWTERRKLIDGQAQLELIKTTKENGWLVVVVKTAFHIAEIPIGAVPDKPDRLRISPPKHINTGEVFTCTIVSPMAGKAFVTLEGETILEAKVVQLKEGKNSVRFKLPSDYPHGNVHVVASLSRAQTINSDSSWAKGATSVKVDRSNRKIKVEIISSDKVRPGARLTVNINAAGAKEAYLALVDEGILQITHHVSPNPVKYFDRTRRLAGLGADIRTSLMEGAQFPDELTVGGDGDFTPQRLEGSTASAIFTLALDSKLLHLDATGNGSFTFTLPEYEGRVRLMALVASPDLVGSASKPVIVNGPVSLKIAVPRMAAPGDELQLSVSVRNNDIEVRDIEVSIQAVGGLTLTGLNKASFHLKPGEGRHLEVPARVTDGGKLATLKISAGWPGEIREVEASFDVRNPGIYEEVSMAVTLSESGEIKIPGLWQGGRVKGELVLSNRPDMRLLAPLETLVGYPYGCVEQTTSKGFALLACTDLLGELDKKKSKEAKQFVKTAINRLMRMQNYHGSLGWWSGSGTEYEYGTIYAGEFLRQCRERGYKVQKNNYEKLIKRVDHWMRGNDISRRCQSIALLAGTGRPIKIWLERLTEITEKDEDKIYLSIAWSRLGDYERAKKLLVSTDKEKKKIVRENGGSLRSSLKLKALRLRAILLCDPKSDEIHSLVSYIEAQIISPRRLSTHELGQSILSLSKFYNVMSDSSQFFKGKINMGADDIAVTREVNIAVDVENGGKISYSGKGIAYGRLLLKGFRTDSSTENPKNIKLKRIVLDVDTGKETEHYKRGGIYEVVLEFNLNEVAENFVISEVLPGGFEAENSRLAITSRSIAKNIQRPDQLEIRDDRIIMFVNSQRKGKIRFAYRMRAVFPGTYKKLPTVFESMYDPENYARLGKDEFVSIAP